MKIFTIKFCALICIGLFVITPMTMAKNKEEVSLAQASEVVRLNTKGKILSARTTKRDGVKTHKIQVLTPSGRVKVFRVPVNSQKSHSRNNSSKNRSSSYPQKRQPSQENSKRSKYRDRPMHNSRLNTPRQNINPRSRTQLNNPSAAREKSDNK